MPSASVSVRSLSEEEKRFGSRPVSTARRRPVFGSSSLGFFWFGKRTDSGGKASRRRDSLQLWTSSSSTFRRAAESGGESEGVDEDKLSDTFEACFFFFFFFFFFFWPPHVTSFQVGSQREPSRSSAPSRQASSSRDSSRFGVGDATPNGEWMTPKFASEDR